MTVSVTVCVNVELKVGVRENGVIVEVAVPVVDTVGLLDGVADDVGVDVGERDCVIENDDESVGVIVIVGVID